MMNGRKLKLGVAILAMAACLAATGAAPRGASAEPAVTTKPTAASVANLGHKSCRPAPQVAPPAQSEELYDGESPDELIFSIATSDIVFDACEAIASYERTSSSLTMLLLRGVRLRI